MLSFEVILRSRITFNGSHFCGSLLYAFPVCLYVCSFLLLKKGEIVISHMCFSHVKHVVEITWFDVVDMTWT
jgi:hypothetical protein